MCIKRMALVLRYFREILPRRLGYYNEFCKFADDKCSTLREVIQNRIEQAREKHRKMFYDEFLYDHAFAKGNPGKTGGARSTWRGRGDDLAGRISVINELIALGKSMNCDMSDEERMAGSLFVPRTPWR